MSDGENADFRVNTITYIADKFMTAVGIVPIEAGPAAFDLHRHTIDGNPVIRLAQWNADNEMAIMGYWVPQGSSCIVPVVPNPARAFVFTPDFSGCAIRVDQIDGANYRVYHVQGGGTYMEDEYTNGPHDHGRGLAGQLDFEDYGTDLLPRAFAFLKYQDGGWKIFHQSQNGIGLGFVAGVLTPIGGAPTVRGGGAREVAVIPAGD